jgi:drug/metabolite transporter (DMT)-like permease
MAPSAAFHDHDRERRTGQLFVALAALAWSTAGVLQRGLSVDTATQLAGRSFFGGLALLAFVLVLSRGRPVGAFRAIGVSGLAVALCTAVATSSFVVALNYANVANVLFMQAVAPVIAAVLAWVALGESISRRSWVAMATAVAGVSLMVGGAGNGGAVGIGASLLMALAFALAIVITRHRRDVSMAPATCLAQLIVVLVVAPFASFGSVTEHDLTLLVFLGVAQMGLGMAFLTMGARLIPAGEVALITLLEVVLGPLWVWISISERPSTAALVGGLVVILGVVLQTTQKTQASLSPRPVPAPDAVR